MIVWLQWLCLGPRSRSFLTNSWWFCGSRHGLHQEKECSQIQVNPQAICAIKKYIKWSYKTLWGDITVGQLLASVDVSEMNSVIAKGFRLSTSGITKKCASITADCSLPVSKCKSSKNVFWSLTSWCSPFFLFFRTNAGQEFLFQAKDEVSEGSFSIVYRLNPWM